MRKKPIKFLPVKLMLKCCSAKKVSDKWGWIKNAKASKGISTPPGGRVSII